MIDKLKKINTLFRTDPKTMFPLFVYAIKAPFHEIMAKYYQVIPLKKIVNYKKLYLQIK